MTAIHHADTQTGHGMAVEIVTRKPFQCSRCSRPSTGDPAPHWIGLGRCVGDDPDTPAPLLTVDTTSTGWERLTVMHNGEAVEHVRPVGAIICYRCARELGAAADMGDLLPITAERDELGEQVGDLEQQLAAANERIRDLEKLVEQDGPLRELARVLGPRPRKAGS